MHLPKFKKKDRKPNVKQKKQKRQPNPLLNTAEYKHFRLLRYINASIIILFLGCAAYVGFFLYNRIFTTIGQVQNILVIDSQIQGDIIDFKTFDKLDANWNAKYAESTSTIIRDPFTPVQVVVIESPTSTGTSTPSEE